MKLPLNWSQRLLRKGPLVEETFQLFSAWDFNQDIEANLRTNLHGRFNTLGWEKEVVSTIGRRLRDLEPIKPFIVLAKSASFADWRDCYRLWVGATEEPFRSFVQNWLYPEYEGGRYLLRSEEARPFVVEAWSKNQSKALSDYGVMRAGRDLLKTASDLVMLAGDGPAKTFATIALSDETFLFYAQFIADAEGAPSRVVESPLWRLAFLDPPSVHAALLRLHQFRRLDYQVAGSLVQLTLPHRSALEFAEQRLAA